MQYTVVNDRPAAVSANQVLQPSVLYDFVYVPKLCCSNVSTVSSLSIRSLC